MDDRDRMHHRPLWIPWAFTSLALVLVAILAYGAGVHQDGAAGDTARHAWYYGGFPFWMFFLMFWVFGLRRLFWGWGCYPYRGWRRGYGYHPYAPYDDEHEWERWHRREHERMDGDRARSASGTPAAGRDPIT